jgi:hypothetical protein
VSIYSLIRAKSIEYLEQYVSFIVKVLST